MFSRSSWLAKNFERSANFFNFFRSTLVACLSKNSISL